MARYNQILLVNIGALRNGYMHDIKKIIIKEIRMPGGTKMDLKLDVI